MYNERTVIIASCLLFHIKFTINGFIINLIKYLNRANVDVV